MWNKEKIPMSPCTQCGTRLTHQTQACPDCGYPEKVDTDGLDAEANETAQSTMMEYKLIQLLGAVVVGAGIIAALADSPIAATVSITVGGGTYLTGLLGSWWNRGD